MTSPQALTSASVTVRYWAGARAAAGVDSETVAGSTVGEVLADVAARHTALESVLKVASILLDGRPAAAGDPLPAGATLEVLPPFAGG